MATIINSLWIYTMNRCSKHRQPVRKIDTDAPATKITQTLLALMLLAPLAANAAWWWPWSTTSSETVVQMAQARRLPPASLRGKITITPGPQGVLNGQTVSMAPGLRVRGTDNILVAPSSLMGQTFVVNYLRDGYGLIQDMWVLREDERAKLWPSTTEEATTWVYEPVSQTWTK
jgi:hypothetical protein